MKHTTTRALLLAPMILVSLPSCINRAGADMSACRMARVACETRARKLEGDLAGAKKKPAGKPLPPDGHLRIDDREGLGLDVAGFTRFDDRASKERISFVAPLETKKRLSVSRRVLGVMQYDGSSGVNQLALRLQSRPDKGDWRRSSRVVYSAALVGQYPLAGFYRKEMVILAYAVEQVGIAPVIIALVGIDTRRCRIHTIGPRGAFQYASVSPDGRYAVLVDDKVVVVDIPGGKSYVVPGASVTARAYPGKGDEIGGGYDLSGKHLEFVWKDGDGGELVGRDGAGKVVHRLPVKVEPARLARPVDRPAT